MPRRALTLALVALLGAAAPMAPAGAGTPQQQVERQGEIKAELRTLREEVAEASAEEAALLDRLDAAHARRRQLDARVAEVAGQVETVEVEARAAEARLEEVQSDFVRAQTQLALAGERLAREHAELRDRAVAAYIANPTSHAADAMLRAGNMREIAASAGYLKTVVEVQRNAVQRYTELRDATKQLQGAVESRKDAAKAQRDVVVNRLAELEGLRAQREAVHAEAVAEEVRQAELLDEVRRRRDEFEAQIAALRAESSTVAALLQGVQVGRPAPLVGALPGAVALASPAPGARVTSLFGPRVHPIFGTPRMHDGVDFGAGMGTPIRAAAAGTVVFAGPRGGYGDTTIIDHGGSVGTLYAHQSAISVMPGTVVAAGQVIGAVGSTGFSTGPHLHFEVRINGVPVDPLLHLPR
ncbi:MAG: peptidoglycan DD-metalloendopeptidase family protein [Actinomycetota bacterium]|nr:peptidoglycan DD-metalloendopeptidase family protein [Actinomycetota bacterium]